MENCRSSADSHDGYGQPRPVGDVHGVSHQHGNNGDSQAESIKAPSAGRSKGSSSRQETSQVPAVFSWLSAPAFQPIQYVPRSARQEIREMPADKLLVVAHEISQTAGNHWCICLQHNGTSVQIDPNPSGPPGTVIQGGTKANIVVSLLDHSDSYEYQHITVVQVVPGVTVGDFIDEIERAGRERYEFNEQATGCRQWTTDLVTLFQQLRLIADPRKADQARADILWQYVENKPAYQDPLDQGAYY